MLVVSHVTASGNGQTGSYYFERMSGAGAGQRSGGQPFGPCALEHRQTAAPDLSFDIHRGETLALVDQSDSGKLATALSIKGLIEREGPRIATGQIRLGKQAPVDLAKLADPAVQAHHGNRISMIFQESTTSPNPAIWIGESLGGALRRHLQLRRGDARTFPKSRATSVVKNMTGASFLVEFNTGQMTTRWAPRPSVPILAGI